MLQISPDILPVTVEEYSTAIKDGVLYTSLSKDSKNIGTGTFELIRARDFANIEATKTGNEANVVHVYANITNPLMGSSSPFQQGVVTSNQTPVIQIPRSVDTEEKGLAAGRAEGKLVESSHGEVSKGSPQPSSSRITSPELSSTRDARVSSIQSSPVSKSSICSMASAGNGDNSEVEKLIAHLTLPKGLADFKANLEAEHKVEHNMNKLAINRLLQRLEGDHFRGPAHSCHGTGQRPGPSQDQLFRHPQSTQSGHQPSLYHGGHVCGGQSVAPRTHPTAGDTCFDGGPIERQGRARV